LSNKSETNIFSNVGGDLAAGLVVFFVAVPLCLGIALASGAPLFSGIVAGIIGGIVIGTISKSQLSVSGPAAGLAAIVLVAITDLGAFNIFLCAVIIAGVFQLVLGFLKAGSIANYLPSNVIEGMLAGIGIIIILKQIPHAVGFDKDYEGNESFTDPAGGNTFSDFAQSLDFLTFGAIIISLVSVAIILSWDKIPFVKNFKAIPSALVAVVVAVVLNEVFISSFPSLAIGKEHLVGLPLLNSLSDIPNLISLPDFSGFLNKKVWIVGLTLAIVASIETLLCLEAVDRLDPLRRYSPTNRELKAQGIGNILSGFLGGLPMTSVIVRSSANVNANAVTKLSAITHGVLLLVSVLAIPFLLNKIPLAVLATILILTGYKLARPALFKKWWSHGLYQFIPFIVTILGIVFTDLLVGVGLGLVVSVFFILRENLKSPYFFVRQENKQGEVIHINLAQEVSFLNKAAIKLTLENLPEESYVIIDASEAAYIDHDVLELIREFKDIKTVERKIRLELVGFKENYKIDNTLDNQFAYVDDEKDSTKSRRKHKELLETLAGKKKEITA
jgi:MFS superfamily sulfate permease-like transporter